MALPATNAHITSTDREGNTKLSNEAVLIGKPSLATLQTLGGRVRHEVALEPDADIHEQDVVYLQDWGAHIIDPNEPYVVIQADPDGALGAEVILAYIGRKQM